MADQSYSSSGGSLALGRNPYEPDLGAADTTLGAICAAAQRFTITGITVVLADDVDDEVTITVSRLTTIDDTSPTAQGTFKIPATGVAGDVFTCRDIRFDLQPGEVAKAKTDGNTSAAGGAAYFEGYESPLVVTTDGVAKADSGVGKLYLIAKD